MNLKPIALVVNDDPFQLRLTTSILTRDGYEVLSCLDAEEGLTQLSQRGADVIITDLYMPGIDGWRLCRLLRSSAYKAFNTIPILVGVGDIFRRRRRRDHRATGRRRLSFGAL